MDGQLLRMKRLFLFMESISLRIENGELFDKLPILVPVFTHKKGHYFKMKHRIAVRTVLCAGE